MKRPCKTRTQEQSPLQELFFPLASALQGRPFFSLDHEEWLAFVLSSHNDYYARDCKKVRIISSSRFYPQRSLQTLGKYQ